MKQITIIFTALVLLSILVSCNKDENDQNQIATDCVFEQIDENMDGLIDDSERLIMDECIANSLSSKSSIKANLIGEWRIIGHGEGWLPTISQPCGKITFSPEELTFEFRNEFIDTIRIFGWDIEEVNSGMFNYFKLIIDSDYQEGLWLTNFCENYIFGDATPSDGNMYLYEKMD